MVFYITKYALSSGITTIEGEISKTAMSMVVEDKPPYNPTYHKPYWHTTEEDAKAHALDMAKKKIVSLKKQIGKLEKVVLDLSR